MQVLLDCLPALFLLCTTVSSIIIVEQHPIVASGLLGVGTTVFFIWMFLRGIYL